jgi:hypothetical protein
VFGCTPCGRKVGAMGTLQYGEPLVARPVQDTRVALLPPLRRWLGPRSTRQLARLLSVYLAMLMVGACLQHNSLHDAFKLFGLGLMLPGAGFLAHADVCTAGGLGHLSLALCAFAAFALSLLIWFGTGNLLAPPLAWLGAAWWAASMRHAPLQPGGAQAVYALLALAAGAVVLGALVCFALARRQRGLDNAYLAAQALQLPRILTAPVPLPSPVPVPVPVPVTDFARPRVWSRTGDIDVASPFAATHRHLQRGIQGGAPAGPLADPLADLPEMSLAHLQRLRFALDRALQALASFEGFEQRDQFQTAATRYQLNFLGYGLALTQARFTPACSAYLHLAQRNLLHKQAQHRVWSYWALENLWGNLCRDPDPVARENIMFTGFVALQMALYQASTGRTEVSQAGFLQLAHPRGQHYAHDMNSLLAQLDAAYAASPLYLVACEPNWVYPLCNMMGASALRLHDAQQADQDRWARHAPAFRQHLEAEFLDAHGRYVPCRSSRTGLALPAIGGAMPQAMPCYFLNALAPDLARRQWLLLRRSLFEGQAPSTGRFKRAAFWPIDTGNYGFSRASAYAATALAAAELGDEAVYAHCMQALDDECPSTLEGGVIHRARASVWSHGVELMARASVRDGFRQLGAAPLPPGGPHLESLSYPEVLVAAAHADAPRSHLRAVLYGGSGDGLQAVGVAGLRAHTLYRVCGATVPVVLSDGRGKARLHVDLQGRTCLHLAPEGDR